MKKRMGLLLTAMVLATTALVSQPVAATRFPLCNPPACYIGPGCCTDARSVASYPRGEGKPSPWPFDLLDVLTFPVRWNGTTGFRAGRRSSRATAAKRPPALRAKLGCPIHNKVLHKEVGRGELDYEVYVRTRELLALQTPADELVVPDEMLFLVVHQTQELWLKCAVFEATNLVERLDGDRRAASSAAWPRAAAPSWNR